MNDRQAVELLVVVAVYLLAFATGIGPTIESVAGFEPLWPTPGLGAERLWRLLSSPQGWLLCLGYVPVQFGYLILRARLAGQSVETYWE